MSKPPVKPLEWVASSKKNLLSMPPKVVDVFGYALHLAQHGRKHQQAKPLKGIETAKQYIDLIRERLNLRRNIQ